MYEHDDPAAESDHTPPWRYLPVPLLYAAVAAAMAVRRLFQAKGRAR